MTLFTFPFGVGFTVALTRRSETGSRGIKDGDDLGFCYPVDAFQNEQQGCPSMLWVPTIVILPSHYAVNTLIEICGMKNLTVQEAIYVDPTLCHGYMLMGYLLRLSVSRGLKKKGDAFQHGLLPKPHPPRAT